MPVHFLLKTVNKFDLYELGIYNTSNLLYRRIACIMETKAYVELFHLLFMQKLSQRIDKRLYSLKGGCNLRFFFNSIRYSEDIDIDIDKMAVNTLKNGVDKILSSIDFARLLAPYGISIINFSSPKQTTTTQKWKVQLQAKNEALSINTKIEFSRRGIQESKYGSISSNLVSNYKIRPTFFSYYPLQEAIKQKIAALLNISVTQSRDIFDLFFLITTNKKTSYNIILDEEEINKALVHIKSIPFKDFYSQVVSYLEVEYQENYNNPDMWKHIQQVVIDHIKDMK